MCCFSRPVKLVSNTNIFARATGRGTQLLAYAMTVAADEDLAMVLPLPVQPGPEEDAVRFISLERYPQFFDDLRSGFPEHLVVAAGPPTRGPVAGGVRQLAVHDVGAFDASFVPTVGDFERLDPRFALPAPVWDQLPSYRDWGFAVFKLKGLAAPPKAVHPMAFEFASRHPDRLFFPTVHVHDGQVHPTASFSHALYCQVPDAVGTRLLAEQPLLERPGFPPNLFLPWAVSDRTVSAFVDASRADGLVDANTVAYRRQLLGREPNADQWISLA
jgi:hypothetical protein